VIAVARGSPGEEGQVALPRGVHESSSAHLVISIVIVVGDLTRNESAASACASTSRIGLARLTLLVLAETAVLELFEQFVEAVAQGLLALPQVAKRVALLALLALRGRQSRNTVDPLSCRFSGIYGEPKCGLSLSL
jgi:hypothetical protein